MNSKFSLHFNLFSFVLFCLIPFEIAPFFPFTIEQMNEWMNEFPLQNSFKFFKWERKKPHYVFSVTIDFFHSNYIFVLSFSFYSNNRIIVNQLIFMNHFNFTHDFFFFLGSNVDNESNIFPVTATEIFGLTIFAFNMILIANKIKV